MEKYVIDNETWRVCDMPERLRPREEMARLGVDNVSDVVLLAILLRAGVPKLNVVDLSANLLRKYGSFTGLANASVDELSSEFGMGPVKAQVLHAALEVGRRVNEEALPKRICIKTPEDAVRILDDRARKLETEVFWVLRLDSKNYLKGEPVDITRGLLDASLVHPREVFREAIRSATAAVVLLHNHPSGDPAPSPEDVRITKQLVDAGRIVDIKVLDHVILGKATNGQSNNYLSMREDGVVRF